MKVRNLVTLTVTFDCSFKKVLFWVLSGIWMVFLRIYNYSGMTTWLRKYNILAKMKTSKFKMIL